MVGERVLVRQQPASPPPTPQVLVLTDQMMEDWKSQDKYLKVFPMVGYTMLNYAQDIRDGFVELQYPYIVVFLGTMQFVKFDSRQVQKDAHQLMEAINDVNPYSHVVFSGLVPRPLDFPQSRVRCENYSRSYQLAMEEFRQ